MIAEKNKQLFAVVYMALTLARAAPLQGGLPVDVVIETDPTDAVIEGPHHHRLPRSARHHHHRHHPLSSDKVASLKQQDYVDERRVLTPRRQALRSFGNSVPRHRSGQELAEHVLTLRDYIDTLDDDEFDAFMDHYLDVGNREEMFALDLALGLDDEERSVQEIDYSFPSTLNNKDYDEIQFVPLQKPKEPQPQPKHAGNPQATYLRPPPQHQIPSRHCPLEDYENGLCVPVHHRYHPPSHAHHRHHRYTQDENGDDDDGDDYYDSEEESDSEDESFGELGRDTFCSEREMRQGLCSPTVTHKSMYTKDLNTLLQSLTSVQGNDGFNRGENRTENLSASHFSNQDILGSSDRVRLPVGIVVATAAS